MKSLSKEDWNEISFSLEEHHAIFYKIWQIGKPTFSEAIDTAAVSFDKEGKYVSFLFNEKFWEETSFYEKLFVICHECLHILLNHGVRIKDTKNTLIANKCLDVVVNHLLVNNFSFEKDKLSNWKEWCWVETVFAEHNIPNNESYEYYFNLHKKLYGDGQSNNYSSLIDDHYGLDFDPKNFLKEALQEVSKQEKNTLNHLIDYFEAGSNEFVLKELLFSEKKEKKKWEKIIFNYCRSKINFLEKEQWLKKNRRLNFVDTNLFLPNESEVEEKLVEKINLYFFMDTSGSCWHLRNRFFKAANSLSNNFNVSLFCFDTNIHEVSQSAVFGGGGTRYSVLESYLLNLKTYPDAIFVLTDGYGDFVSPRYSNRWHWFLTSKGYKSYIPKDSHIHFLEDFE